ncbi:MAG: response regulator [Desulfobacterales bacterium]|nr:response regulator [Desulfobacterales bacterium]
MPKKILIVDDEPSIIVALQFLMEQNGYETLVAFSGEEAMEAGRQAPSGSDPAGHHAAGGGRVRGAASGCARTRTGRTSASCC